MNKLIIGMIDFFFNCTVCEDDMNRNPAYEQGSFLFLLWLYYTSITVYHVFIHSVMIQRAVLSENQAYASIRNEREHNLTTRTYENIPHRQWRQLEQTQAACNIELIWLF